MVVKLVIELHVVNYSLTLHIGYINHNFVMYFFQLVVDTRQYFCTCNRIVTLQLNSSTLFKTNILFLSKRHIITLSSVCQAATHTPPPSLRMEDLEKQTFQPVFIVLPVSTWEAELRKQNVSDFQFPEDHCSLPKRKKMET